MVKARGEGRAGVLRITPWVGQGAPKPSPAASPPGPPSGPPSGPPGPRFPSDCGSCFSKLGDPEARPPRGEWAGLRVGCPCSPGAFQGASFLLPDRPLAGAGEPPPCRDPAARYSPCTLAGNAGAWAAAPPAWGTVWGCRLCGAAAARGAAEAPFLSLLGAHREPGGGWGPPRGWAAAAAPPHPRSCRVQSNSARLPSSFCSVWIIFLFIQERSGWRQGEGV